MPAKKTPVKSTSRLNSKKSVSKTSAKGGSSLAPKFKFSKRTALVIVLLFAGIGAYLIFRSFAVTPTGTYTHWNWQPPAEGYSSIEHSLAIDDVTNGSPYFWSHQVQFIDGDGGYAGLQSKGHRIDGSVGKSAVFSIFSAAIEARGACKIDQSGFDGGTGSGTSCIMAYDWVKGRSYQFRMVQGMAESNGRWWVGYVKDSVTGASTEIGQIKVPVSWKGLGSWSVMWTEYFGPTIATCDDFPYSNVRFSSPTANNGAVKPASTSNTYGNGDCTTSKVTNISGGVRHEMGNPALSTPASANLALGKPAVASSLEASWLTAGQAFDGNTATRWASAYSDPQWIYVDLGATYNISQVRLYWETAYGKSYKIQASNDAQNWTDLYATTNGNGGIDDITGLSGSGRYVRMYGTARGTPYGYSLWEFEVYGSSATADTTLPIVTITSPADGARIRHSVSIQATATDNVGVTKMQIYIDGRLSASSTGNSISYKWNSKKAAKGSHNITVKAYDAAGNAGQSSVTVYK